MNRKDVLEMEDLKRLLNRIFSGEDGKKFDKFLQSICYANRSSFTGDPYQLAFNEGRRSVYLTLKTLKEGGKNE